MTPLADEEEEGPPGEELLLQEPRRSLSRVFTWRKTANHSAELNRTSYSIENAANHSTEHSQ